MSFPESMLIDYAAITHPGKVRKNNEDAYLVSVLDGEEPQVNSLRRHPNSCPKGLLAAVADGMGGAAAGEVASREGLASIALYLFGHWGRFPGDRGSESLLMETLLGAAEAASQAVLRYSDDDRTARGMGSTLTASVIWEGHAYLCQVGDSRAYLYRRPELVQLTQDQTLVNQMIQSGTLTPLEAQRHPQRSMITQALGCPQPVKAVLGKVRLRRGDRLLLCSDGLHGEVGDGELKAILDHGFSTRRSLELMVEAALAKGARDNVTALLLALDDPALPLPHPRLDVVRVESPSSGSPAEVRSFSARLGRLFGARS